MNHITIILLLILVLFLTSCNKYDAVFIGSGEEEITIKVEIADSTEERKQGLMFREHLDSESGMLFIFDSNAYYSFWMKNTLIPLDIIFISEDYKIIDIFHAEPCKDEPCRMYKSTGLSMYVLEVNGNFTINNGIEKGDNVRFGNFD